MTRAESGQCRPSPRLVQLSIILGTISTITGVVSLLVYQNPVNTTYDQQISLEEPKIPPLLLQLNQRLEETLKQRTLGNPVSFENLCLLTFGYHDVQIQQGDVGLATFRGYKIRIHEHQVSGTREEPSYLFYAWVTLSPYDRCNYKAYAYASGQLYESRPSYYVKAEPSRDAVFVDSQGWMKIDR